MIQRRAYIKRRTTLAHARAKAKAAGHVDPDSWQAVVEFYGGLCGYCERAPWQQQDHRVPLSRGGEHAIHNVVPSCQPCNTKKGTQTWPVPRPHPFMETAR